MSIIQSMNNLEPKVLVLVDLQNDFLPGGALAVPDGDQVIRIANRLVPHFDLVLATQDWHPANHGSFAANHPGKKVGDVVNLNGVPQVLWPVHCVQDTRGAEFAPGLNTAGIHRVFRKGTDPGIDSYSTFFDNAHRKSTGLGEYLSQAGLRELHIMGLATDYCVKFSVLDARGMGFAVRVIIDACRGIDLKSGDIDAAIADMTAAGATVESSAEIPMAKAH